MATRQPAEESLLFDLPLDQAPLGERAGDGREADEIEQVALPLTPSEPAGESAAVEEAGSPAAPRPDVAAEAATPVRLRAAAGLVDLGACVAVLVVLLAALGAMDVSPRAADWPAAALFLLAFSFLYQVLPLAFWGRTPGMAAAGIRSTSRDGGPLTFRQAAICWLASVLTVALAGLPLLLVLGGRSLGNRMSGSLTRRSALPR